MDDLFKMALMLREIKKTYRYYKKKFKETGMRKEISIKKSMF
jgi:hypothetical protein